MKKNNPDIPILIREAQGTLPKIFARYGPSPPLPVPVAHAPPPIHVRHA